MKHWMWIFLFGLSGVLGAAEPQAKHVVAVSIDGLRPDAITQLGPDKAPVLNGFLRHGAYTLNARTDAHFTNTLPNHTAMLTGRGVKGNAGHNYTHNGMPKRSLHKNKGAYLSSIFDVSHDAGLKTALLASKAKFMVYMMSWGKDGDGGPDKTGEDNGKQKIDIGEVQNSDPPTIKNALEALKARPNFMFVHFRGTDSTGHKRRWMSEAYLKEVQNRDADLGKIIAAIKADPQMAKETVVIVTADHGGTGKGHNKSSDRKNYTIPFLIWGKGVAEGKELYALNPTRADPGEKQVPYDAPKQPIRNGDVANLAARILGLPAVPGSFIGAKQDLKTR